MSPFLLWVLASTDSLFSGFRAAAGRNPRIFKQRYYTKAILRGLIVGQSLIACAALLILGLVLWGPDSEATYEQLVAGADAMVWVYGTYASVVLCAFLPYFYANSDVRTSTAVAVFGPLTLVRPAVVVTGAIAAMTQVPTWTVAVATAVGVAAVMALEPILNRWYAPKPKPLGSC